MKSHLKTLSVLSVLLSAMLLAWVVFDGVSRLNRETRSGPASQPMASSVPSGRAGYNVERIVQAHLFGKKEIETSQAALLPETKLQLDLLGMVSSSSEEYARALIAVNARNVKVYRVGDSIDGTDATLHAVETKRVLLDRNGVVESLRIKRPDVFSAAADSGPVSLTADPAEEESSLSEAAYNVEPGSETDDGANEIRYSGVTQPGGKQTKLPF